MRRKVDMAPFRLSKSRLLSGLQCPKRLYLEIHQPELAKQSKSAERLFSNGHLVGDIARRAHTKGRLIDHTDDLKAALAQTEEELKGEGSMTLFEPAFQHGGALVRADIFSRKGTRHHVVEVKSSSAVKDYHLNDAAIQYWVIGGAGVPLDSMSIAHVDTSFVYEGDGGYRGLLKRVDVTEEIEACIAEVPDWIRQFRKILAGRMPKIEIGRQCSKPFDCPFIAHCSQGQPEYPVDLLPHGGNVVATLRAAGYRDLRKVPASLIEGSKHKLIWRVTKSGKPEIDARVRKLMRELPYPRFYLDFETIQFAVPIWKATQPYEKLPFQWSCHIEREGGDLTHREFIDLSGEPPMRAFAESLVKNLGERGPIIVYSHFERTIIKALAARYPDLDRPLNKLIGRLRDLLNIMENSYYHRDMKGSWSLKAVLPTVAPDLDYASVGEVQDGGDAQSAFIEIIDPATSGERKRQLTHDLKEYCKLDTLAMVRLARFLAGK
jgi:hypothetical protein